MNQKELNCALHKNNKFQYFCLKEECIQQKPSKCQLFYCISCYEELDEKDQLQNHKLHHISVLNQQNKKTIFKNEQATGDELWQLIKQKNNGSMENFENDCLEINQKFNQIKEEQLQNLKQVQSHFQLLKSEINLKLSEISKNIDRKIDECRNLYTPTDVMKFANKKTKDFQDLVSMLADEPKESLKFYKDAYQNQLISLRRDTKNLLVATQFSKQIRESNQEQEQNVYLQQTDVDQIEAEKSYNNQRSHIFNQQNNQQQQLQIDQQEQNNRELDLDENNIKILKFREINYSSDLGIQINQKIREFQDYMHQILQVCQTQSQPLNQILQNNLEISQQVQQLVNQQQLYNQQENNQIQQKQQFDQIINQKKIIQQYTDSVKFFEDFPAINNQQQYKKLTKFQINAITDLRVQLGYYHDFKNGINSYGYNSLGKQGVKEINEIIFNNLELKNLQNLSLNYHKSNLSIQEYLQMINQLGSWQQTSQIRKLSLGYTSNNLDQQKVSQIIQQLFGIQKFANLKELELEFNFNYFSELEFYSSQFKTFLKNLQQQSQLQQDEYLNNQFELQDRQMQLKEFKFYLYNLEKLNIKLCYCKINNKKLSKISEQVALLGVFMPKLSFLEIQLLGNEEITDEGINTFSQSLANSSLLKNLKEISFDLNGCENISDDSLIKLSEILVSKGKNLNAISLQVCETNISSKGIKIISEIICTKLLKKLQFCFSDNNQTNGQEIIDVVKCITQSQLPNLSETLNNSFFHQHLQELNISVSDNLSEQQMLEFFNILTNSQYFPSLSILYFESYSQNLNDDNFQTIWNNLTNPQSLTKLKYLNLCLVGSKISPESQVLASLKIAQTAKFQNLEELILIYENARLNKQVNNQICAVNIVQNLVNSENLKNLKHLSLDFGNNDLKAEGCQQVVEELSKPKNKLSLEVISLNFYDNGIEKNQYQELNRQFRNSLITEQLRVANIFFDFV